MKPQLVFGNPEHIQLAQEGQICECGHSKAKHKYYCIDNKSINESCDNCGYTHECWVECDCTEFKQNKNLKFNEKTGLFKK